MAPRRGSARLARRRRAFLEAYGGDEVEAADAFYWLEHPDAPGPSGATAPAADVDGLRVALYQPDPPDDLPFRYRQAVQRQDLLRQRTEAALAVGKPRRERRLLTIGLIGAALLVPGLAVPLLLPPSRSATPALPPNVATTVRTIPLAGIRRDADRLRNEIEAGQGDATALVTRTAYAAIPVLQATDRAAGNEATLRGSAMLNLDALEQVTGPRSVTVLVVCGAPTRYRWVLQASRLAGRGPSGPQTTVAHGSGRSCDRGMDAATVQVPRGWYPGRIRLVTASDRRYLLSVQVVG